jgi:hypothetical protein
MLVLRLTAKQQQKVDLQAAEFKREQERCAAAISEVMTVYARSGYRKVNPDSLPLRFEVDSFLARIVDKFIGSQGATAYPLLSPVAREQAIFQAIVRWEDVEDDHLRNKAANLYPKLQKVFSSVSSIHTATDQQIGEALEAIRSFYSSARYAGGFQPKVDKLFSENDPTEIRDLFAYLLHGKEPYEMRLAIFTVPTNHKIKQFGPSSAIELLGWCNKEDVMIFTDKTKKALRYLGFDIAVDA